jgi:hypothetical protein
MIYFCSIEVAIVEAAIDEGYRDKTAEGEIASIKSAGFKFFEIDFIFTVSDIIVLYVELIFRHFLGWDCFCKKKFLRWLNYCLIA